MPAKLRNSAARGGGPDGCPVGERAIGRVCRLNDGNGRRRRMDYRTLGVSGLKVSPLCLGTMMFGGATDEATSARIVARARDQGVNFVDTADGYNGGETGERNGRAVPEHRRLGGLGKKRFNPTGAGPHA